MRHVRRPKRGVFTFAGAPNVLRRYVVSVYVRYYVVFALIYGAIIAPTIVVHPAIAYLVLAPFAALATFAVCATVFELGSNGGFETMQSFGVPFKSVFTPLTLGPLVTQGAVSVLSMVFSVNVAQSAFYATISLAAMTIGVMMIVVRAWETRCTGTAQAYLPGVGVQALMSAGNLAILVFAPAFEALAAIVAILACLLYLVAKQRSVLDWA